MVRHTVFDTCKAKYASHVTYCPSLDVTLCVIFDFAPGPIYSVYRCSFFGKAITVSITKLKSSDYVQK
jgi:hypothetical protein